MQVAISQPGIIFGGRIKVLLGLTEAMNRRGIEPVWLTKHMPGEVEVIKAKYKTAAEFSVHVLPEPKFWFPDEWSLVLFNKKVSSWCKTNGIDILFNSSNTVKGFSGFPRMVSYVHYPREARALSSLGDIHTPGSEPDFLSKRYIYKRLTRLFYRLGDVARNHCILCNSEFTKEAFFDVYGDLDLQSPVEVIYPFCSQNEIRSSGRSMPAVATLGRICSAKRQLEQVKIGAELDDLKLWIMGHASETNPYYIRVQEAAKQAGDHVEVFANLPYDTVQENLRQCRYFLHTNINEPFGITTVEAILNGSLPIVHNSGGQKEVVCFDELRYDNLDEIPHILRKLESSEKSRNAMLTALQNHVLANFTQNIFDNKADDFLARILEPAV